MQNKEEKIITLEDLLNKFDKQNKEFIKNVEKEEQFERIETLDAIQNDIKAQQTQTERAKNKFAQSIVSGLGEKVKANPNKVIVIKKPWHVKFKEFIKKIFTKF
jgi:C4-type Zn-finger protein